MYLGTGEWDLGDVGETGIGKWGLSAVDRRFASCTTWRR